MKETSKHIATIKQDFRVGMLVWVFVMFDACQLKIIGYSEPTGKWQVQWLSGPGSFYIEPDRMFKRRLINGVPKFKRITG